MIHFRQAVLAGAPVAQRGKKGYMVSFEDVNGDGLDDLMMHVEIALLRPDPGTGDLLLEGMYLDREIYGSDSVRFVPSNGMVCAFGEEAWMAAFGPEGAAAELAAGLRAGDLLAMRDNGLTWQQLAREYVNARLLEASGVEQGAVGPVVDEAGVLLGTVRPNSGMNRTERQLFRQNTELLSAFNAAQACGF